MLLKTVPFELDVAGLAAGLLKLFDDDERARLRLGLLPAPLMDTVKVKLRDKFLEKAELFEIHPDDTICTIVPGKYVAYCSQGRRIEFSMSTLLNEALMAISLELYRIGDLVV